MPLDDPNTWSQGALAFKSIFDGLRSAISMLREVRGGQKHGNKESKLIEAALDKASTSTAIAEAEVGKALGFELCKCQFPPTPMLTVGMLSGRPEVGPVFECPKCGFNTAHPFGYERLAPERENPPE